MSALRPWRDELRALIPRGFLRRDQGEGLFVSDYPRHGDAAAITMGLMNAGYTVSLRGRIVGIDAQADKYRSLLEQLPDGNPAPREETLALYALARQMVRSKAPFSPQAVPTLRMTLKYLEAGNWAALERALPPLRALAQRQKRPLPAALGKLILFSLPEGGYDDADHLSRTF